MHEGDPLFIRSMISDFYGSERSEAYMSLTPEGQAVLFGGKTLTLPIHTLLEDVRIGIKHTNNAGLALVFSHANPTHGGEISVAHGETQTLLFPGDAVTAPIDGTQTTVILIRNSRSQLFLFS